MKRINNTLTVKDLLERFGIKDNNKQVIIRFTIPGVSASESSIQINLKDCKKDTLIKDLLLFNHKGKKKPSDFQVEALVFSSENTAKLIQIFQGLVINESDFNKVQALASVFKAAGERLANPEKNSISPKSIKELQDFCEQIDSLILRKLSSQMKNLATPLFRNSGYSMYVLDLKDERSLHQILLKAKKAKKDQDLPVLIKSENYLYVYGLNDNCTRWVLTQLDNSLISFTNNLTTGQHRKEIHPAIYADITAKKAHKYAGDVLLPEVIGTFTEQNLLASFPKKNGLTNRFAELPENRNLGMEGYQNTTCLAALEHLYSLQEPLKSEQVQPDHQTSEAYNQIFNLISPCIDETVKFLSKKVAKQSWFWESAAEARVRKNYQQGIDQLLSFQRKLEDLHQHPSDLISQLNTMLVSSDSLVNDTFAKIVIPNVKNRLKIAKNSDVMKTLKQLAENTEEVIFKENCQDFIEPFNKRLLMELDSLTDEIKPEEREKNLVHRIAALKVDLIKKLKIKGLKIEEQNKLIETLLDSVFHKHGFGIYNLCSSQFRALIQHKTSNHEENSSYCFKLFDPSRVKKAPAKIGALEMARRYRHIPRR